jgi:hypothetical protein
LHFAVTSPGFVPQNLFILVVERVPNVFLVVVGLHISYLLSQAAKERRDFPLIYYSPRKRSFGKVGGKKFQNIFAPLKTRAVSGEIAYKLSAFFLGCDFCEPRKGGRASRPWGNSFCPSITTHPEIAILAKTEREK